MYTQCPECETTFKLGADELRRAGGKVRCGDCNTVFNALDYLAEEVSEGASDTAATDPTAASWTSSASNPNGDVAPDLDEYEQNAYTEADDNEIPDFDHEVDEEDDGAILYIDDSTDTEESAEDSADDDSEFDDSVWEKIPGVGVGLGEDEDEDEDDEYDQVDETETDTESDDLAAAEPIAVALGDTASDPGSETDLPEGEAVEDLEFNVPEDKWTNFFGPLPKGQVAAVWQPPTLSEDEQDASPDDAGAADSGDDAWDELGTDTDDEAATAVSTAETTADSQDKLAPQWPAAEEPSRFGGLVPLAVLAAAVLLVTQLIHYNRDSLAASPTYGQQIRTVYATLGSELYPEWDINGYEIRGSEAIAGESGADIMDIRAQIANIGEHAAELPRLRVVLRDRWSNPVAARDFGPDEYATDVLPDELLLEPGGVTSAHVSIRDPGAGAQGFELELCLPRRHTGLECTGQPFK